MFAQESLNSLCLEYSYADLQQATKNFDASCKVGEGAFGGVFKGLQRDGTEVAIKVLDVSEEGGFEEEVRVLSKFRHPNLVILMGFASQNHQRLLVYELLAGGDVYKRLQRSCREGVPFPWRQRVSAACDAACGLSHLHHSKPKVFHRDIKSANILLDRNGTAKMADFGLACLSHKTTHKVKSAGGTVGYTCPLYVQRGVVTEGSEAYSFGMVLFELFTAKLPAWRTQAPDGSQQYQFMVSVINGDLRTALSLEDEMAQWPMAVGTAVAELALMCTQNAEEKRAGFADIANVLRALRDTAEAPAAPAPPTPVLGGSALVPGAPVQQVVVRREVVQQPQPQVQAQPQAVIQRVSAAEWEHARRQQQQQQQQQQHQQHQQHQQQQPHQQQAPRPPPLLWSLECTYADGVNVSSLPREQRTLMHRHEQGGPLLTTQRVGRLFQEDFFNAVIPDSSMRGVVSREHFQVWAEETPIGTEHSTNLIPCSFFLTQFSSNRVTVNGAALQKPGEQTSLHRGDKIAIGRFVEGSEKYEPFIQFRFTLAGSVLMDADSGHADPEHTPGARKEDVPSYYLEAGGAGLREGVGKQSRRLVPEDTDCTLMLGRVHNSEFWQRVLTEDAYNALSRHCCQIEMSDSSKRHTTYYVRNLSERNTICVCTSFDDGQAEPIGLNERIVVSDGNIIVVNRLLWISFNLTFSGPEQQQEAQVADHKMCGDPVEIEELS